MKRPLHATESFKGIDSTLQSNELNDSIYGISFHFSQGSNLTTIIRNLVDETLEQLTEIINNTDLSLKGGPVWSCKYEEDEDAFCIEVLQPLLQKMGFSSIRYVHGNDEFGKDFVFLDTSL